MEPSAALPEGVPAGVGSPGAGSWTNWGDWAASSHSTTGAQDAAAPAPGAAAGAHPQGDERAAPPPASRRRYAIRTPAGDGGLVRFTLARTSRSFYLVGSTADGARARMVAIDRASQDGTAAGRRPLDVQLHPPEYARFLESRPSTRAMADEYLAGLERGDAKAFERTEICGLLGALRFTEGYYLVVVKEAVPVGRLGCHDIFRTEEMQLVQVSNDVAGWTMPRIGSWAPPEAKNKQKLLGAHLEKDFYFSRTYDLTHALQFNVCGVTASASQTRRWEPQSMFLWNHFLLSGLSGAEAVGGGSPGGPPAADDSSGFEFVRAEMALGVICGNVSQKQMSLVGRTISLTLIARRSRHFAGTRYRKRGINNQGYVANDVETEQIVHDDASRVHPIGQHYTSFVQVRGSVPVYWSQETALTTVQPKIDCKIIDPSYHATMLHFSDLMSRYGHPIVCLNLVKEGRDKSGLLESSVARMLDSGEGGAEAREPHREVKLANEYVWAFDHISKSLPRKDGRDLLEYTHRDLRRIKAEAAIDEAQHQHEQDQMTATMESMVQGATVTLPGLEDLSVQVEKLGFFDSDDVRFGLRDGQQPAARQLQRGVVRSNCVDSLDRTNTAQFHLGLYALGHQLHALGVIPEKNGNTVGQSRLDLSDEGDKDITIVLAQLYEEMGNTIALQYGGSEAHQFMLAKLEGRSEFLGSVGDAVKSVRRYYANSISDQEKQGAINLFLGKFEEQFELMALGGASEREDVWELESDWHLHNREEDWPLPCQPGEHTDFFSGDLKWWEIALAKYDQRVAAIEPGTVGPSEPPTAQGTEPSAVGSEGPVPAANEEDSVVHRFGVLPTQAFEQEYRLCRCPSASECTCSDTLSSFGGLGGDPGAVPGGLLDAFAEKMAYVKQPYVSREAVEALSREEMEKDEVLQVTWEARPPPSDHHPQSHGVDLHTRPAARTARDRNKDSITMKHEQRREWVAQYISRTEMLSGGEMSGDHLLSDEDGEQRPEEYDASAAYAFALSGAAAAAEMEQQEQQLDRLRIDRQRHDPTVLKPDTLCDNNAIYEDYVPARQQRDAMTGLLIHHIFPPPTTVELTDASAQTLAEEKSSCRAKLSQMTLWGLRERACELGIDTVSVETAMLGEELELTELPTAAVASADAAAHAGEQTLGMIRGWRENDWWQSGRAASAANGAEMGSIREVQTATERLQEQLRRRLLAKLGPHWDDVSPAENKARQPASQGKPAGPTFVELDLESCREITGEKMKGARKEVDLIAMQNARILEKLLGRFGLGVLEGGASESATMTSAEIYQLLLTDEAMDEVVERLRASLTQDELYEECDFQLPPGSLPEDLEPEPEPDSESAPKAVGGGVVHSITHRTRSTPSRPALFDVGGDYDSLLGHVGGVSKAYHRLSVPGQYHAEGLRQKTQDEPEVVEELRDDGFLTGCLAGGTKDRAEGLKLLIELCGASPVAADGAPAAGAAEEA